MHKLLAKQLEKARQADGDLDLDRLLALVARAYEEAEQDRERTDRSIGLMVGELDAFQADLEARIASRTAELHESRKALKLQNARFATALENMSHAISMYDNQHKLVTCNRQFLELYKLPKHLGRRGTEFQRILEQRVASNTFVGDDPHAYLKERLQLADVGVPSTAVHRLNSGQVVSVTHQPMADGGWVSTHKDITEINTMQEELRRLAYHDALTGLPNRNLLQQLIGERIAEMREDNGFAILFLDLDGFKTVNDTLGHATGDDLLKQVAGRLAVAVGDAGTVGRMGGDEFAIVTRMGTLAADAHMLAVGLQDAIKPMFEIERQQASVALSVGIAVAPGDGSSAEQLLKNADLALYAAKREQRGSYRFFDEGMERAIRTRQRMERDLRRALERGELELFYQPILNLKSQVFSGFEALLRWRHPVDGMISPADFVPLAEETGLILPIGEWVVREALAEATRWPKGIRVAVNVSSVQFQRGNVVAMMMNALAASGLSPGRVEVEITESVFLDNNADNLDTLKQLHALGLRIALDDFGTGYSALSYLLKFPFDKIKIDGSFVRALDNAEVAHTIVRSVSDIGNRMGITTTAEGVETAEQLRNVYAVGYSEAQGFLISRPMPRDAVRAMLKGEDDEMPDAPFQQRAAS